MKNLLIIGALCLGISFVDCKSTQAQTTSKSKITTEPTTKPSTVTPTPGPPTTTLTPAQAYSRAKQADTCQRSNASCDVCVKIGSVQCVWCESTKSCMLKEHVIPTSECALKDAKWAVCWVNYEALIIACSVIGGLLILGFTVCICCCCCCKKDNSAKYAKEDAKVERKKSEMKEKHSERRAERRAKTDEIRKKYGLIKEDNPYSRFENN